jgi:hypothetical protein
MAADARELLEFFASLVPADESGESGEFPKTTHRSTLMMRKLELLRTRWVVPVQRRCLAAYRMRFGELPPGFDEDLKAMTLPMLQATELFIAECTDTEAFHHRVELLRRTYVDGIKAGWRLALRIELDRRFGRLARDFVYLLALDCADDMDLALCVERLHNAATLEEVFDPLLHKLGVDHEDALG